MSTLGEQDRPVMTFLFERWGREVSCRAPGAKRLVEMQQEIAEANQSQEGQLRWFSQLLAETMVEPTGSADEWATDVQLPTLIELGGEVLSRCGLDLEQKKTD